MRSRPSRLPNRRTQEPALPPCSDRHPVCGRRLFCAKFLARRAVSNRSIWWEAFDSESFRELSFAAKFVFFRSLSTRRRGGMADALDSKSSDRKIVWVQVPPPALLFRVEDGFYKNLREEYSWAMITVARIFLIVAVSWFVSPHLYADAVATLRGVVRDPKGQPL